ncbi:MAG: HepT-like ribonuclease domain-containing protein [Candidatus Poribacteria bacterium]
MSFYEGKLAEIFKGKDGIVAVYLFGSQVKGKTDKVSDFDFAVLFEDGYKSDDQWNITGDLLCEAFSVVGQDKADVVVLSNQPLWFQQVVVKTGKIIYEVDKKKRLFYEKALMRKCLQEGLPDYVEDGKMKKEDVQINFDTIEENLEKLEGLRRLSYDEFMDNPYYLDAAVHELQTSIEALADISRYVIRSLSLSPAQEYWKIPTVLSDAGYIDPKDAEVYVKMVRFRNLVVHHYYRVNPEEVYNIVTENLLDIQHWRDRLLEIIEKQTNA